MAKDGAGGGDAAMAGQREIESSSHAVTFDRGDDWSGEAGDRTHQRLSYLGELIGFGTGQLGNLVEVGTCREVMFPTNHERLWRLVRREIRYIVCKFGYNVPSKTIDSVF